MPRPYRRRRRPATGPQRRQYSRAEIAEMMASSFISEAVGEWRCDLPDYPSITRFSKAVMAWARGAPRPELPEGTELVRGFNRLVEFITAAHVERLEQAEDQALREAQQQHEA
jgi:hypothetical protein